MEGIVVEMDILLYWKQSTHKKYQFSVVVGEGVYKTLSKSDNF